MHTKQMYLTAKLFKPNPNFSFDCEATIRCNNVVSLHHTLFIAPLMHCGGLFDNPKVLRKKEYFLPKNDAEPSKLIPLAKNKTIL